MKWFSHFLRFSSQVIFRKNWQQLPTVFPMSVQIHKTPMGSLTGSMAEH